MTPGYPDYDEHESVTPSRLWWAGQLLSASIQDTPQNAWTAMVYGLFGGFAAGIGLWLAHNLTGWC